MKLNLDVAMRLYFYGKKLFQADARSSEECHDLCHLTPDCGWFSFDAFPSTCFIFQDCPTLDESAQSCISSSAKCKGKTSKAELSQAIPVGFIILCHVFEVITLV